LYFEEAATRIKTYLLTCQPPTQYTQQIQDATGISSPSKTLRTILKTYNWLQKLTIPKIFQLQWANYFYHKQRELEVAKYLISKMKVKFDGIPLSQILHQHMPPSLIYKIKLLINFPMIEPYLKQGEITRAEILSLPYPNLLNRLKDYAERRNSQIVKVRRGNHIIVAFKIH